MGKATSVANSFIFGELSPRSYGLFSAEKPVWRNGASIIENFLIWQTGGALFSPGTKYCVETKDSSKKSILRKFRYSITQSYVMEVGALYFRFVANKGQLVKSVGTSWLTNTAYKVGDIVYTGSPAVIYRCLVAHTSGTFATDLAAGDWIIEINKWVTGTPYVVGDYVYENSIIYYCIVAHTSAAAFSTDLTAVRWVAQTAVEVSTPYAQADINTLQTANKADVMYIVHPSYAPYKLVRTSATTFTLSKVNLIRGPFMDTNITTTTITPSADAGTGITLTASTAIFQPGHVGSLWLIKGGVVKITAFTSQTVVTGDVQAEPTGVAGALGTGPAATLVWAEGAFSDVRGWPSAVTFHEGRLVYGGPGQFIDGSVVGGYDNFAKGSSNAADAFRYELATDIVTTIRWLASTDVLSIGTSGGTASAAGGGGVGITPTNIQVKFDTDYSVQSLLPETISSYLYYLQANTFQLRQLVFDLYLNKSKSEDMTLLADHILRDGLGAVDMDRQQSPNDRLWIVRADGQLALFTRNAEQQVMGWSRRTGGVTAAGAGLFEGICTLTQDGDDDLIYVTVNRNINGSTKRYIEYFTPELFSKYYEPVRLDCSSTLDNPITITGISQASPCVVTAPGHGLSDGDQIKIDNVVGMTNVNMNKYLVANKTTDNFEITTLLGVSVDSSLYSLYLSGGEVRKMVTAISGLDYLDGEYVYVVSDGGVNPQTQSFLVSGGAITLPTKVAVAHFGLPYQGTLRLLPLGDGSGHGSGQTKPHRIYDSALVVAQSLGGNIGIDSSHMSRIVYPTQTGNVVAGQAPLPYSGALKKIPVTGWNANSNITITQDLPLPMMILAVIIDSEESDKG
jgi:hypothetical protein